MELRLYDTLTREKRVFTPLDPANVRMYVCGPTVYDFAHIGNARPVIVFDVLFRLLRHIYGDKHVTYVRNITDVDDKINERASRDFPKLPLNEAIRKVTEQTANQFHADVAGLGSLPPTFEPRATDFVLPRADGKADMVTLIKELVARGHAYEAGGEVLFDTQSMPDYGALSGRKLDEQLAGARVAVDVHKKNPADFVLWKQSSENEPGWDSPWGRGRPGWHIECSAMSAAYLGDVFDIHGGGLDLIFPHHENEIAQSRCAHGTPTMANYWMHNGFLEVEGAKMSKSLGNFVTIRELLGKYFGSALRFTMLKTNYREPIDWTKLAVEQSRQEMGRWAELVYENKHIQPAAEADAEFVEHLLDDLNTPNAITRLRELYKRAHLDLAWLPVFLASAQLLGLDIDKPGYFRSAIAYYPPEGQQEQAHEGYVLAIRARTAVANNLPEATNLLAEIRARGANYLITDDGDIQLSFSESPVEEIVKEKIELRNIARANRNFKEADRIRDELVKMKVVLKDGKDANGNPMTTWEVSR